MEGNPNREIKPSGLIYVFVGIYFLIAVAMASVNGGACLPKPTMGAAGSGGVVFSSYILYLISKGIWKSWLTNIENNHLRTFIACIIGWLIYAIVSFIILSMILGML